MTSTATASQQFCVRWNSHLGSLGAAFPQLLAGQRFVDVTLACEGHQVHCHRLVLAACSTYFESLLGENPCKHPIIILPRDIRLWEIQALVDFMYKGEVNVSQAGLADLLKCAETLQIRGLCGTDAALNLNQLTQMGIGTAKLPTANNGPTVAVKSSNGLIEKSQPSLLSTALTSTGKVAPTNKSSNPAANKTPNNDAISRLPVITTQTTTTTVPNKTPDTAGQRRSERKSNQQQKVDEQEELVLDDDIEIKCEDLIIDEDELLKEHNVTTDDCDDDDMDAEKMNEEETFQNFQNQAQPSTPTTPQPSNENDEEDSEISSPPLNIQTPLLKTYISRKPTQQSASPGVATPSSTSTTSTNTKSSQARGSIRVKSNENLFENYDKQIKITAAAGSVVDGGGKSGDYQIINQQTGKPSTLPASLKFNHRTMEIMLKPSKNAKKVAEQGEAVASPEQSEGGDNDYEDIVCAPSFDELSSAYDDDGDNDEDLNQYYDEMDNLQNCDNDDYDFPTIIDDYDEPTEDGSSASVSFGGQGNADYSNSSDLKPFMYQTPSLPMKMKNSKLALGRAAPYGAGASNTNNNVIMTPREMSTTKSDMLEKLLANGAGRPPVAFVLRNPRGNQPRTYTTDALWAALMDVKSGESIYRASQLHKVPRKTLRNWMKRWDIKSAYPMPRQLQQAAERKKLIRDSLMTPPKLEAMIKPESSATSDPTNARTYSIALH